MIFLNDQDFGRRPDLPYTLNITNKLLTSVGHTHTEMLFNNEADVTQKERAVKKVAPKASHGISSMQPTFRQKISDVTLPLSLIYILTMQEVRSEMVIRVKIFRGE